MLVLAWESPGTGTVDVSLSVRPVEGQDGITLTVERNGPHRELMRRVFQPGEGGRIELESISVSKGDRLYFVGDMLPGGEGSQLVLDELAIRLTKIP